MVTVVFRNPVGEDTVVEAADGVTLLEVALANGIRGILGDCGGEMSCGTCHAYIDEAALAKLPDPSGDEQIMIEDGVIDPQPNSRLCCQIVVSQALDGTVVSLPARA